MHFPKQLFGAPNKDFLIHRRRRTQITSKICILFASLLLAPSFFAASLEEGVSSKNNERLRQTLEKFPEADTNKDGVLTLIEARAFIAQQRAKEDPQSAPSSSKAVLKEGEIKGYNGLYMGHSFFQPSVRQLGKMIPSNIKGHTQYICLFFLISSITLNITPSLFSSETTTVSIVPLPLGSSFITEESKSPYAVMASVLGIGVAVIISW